MGCSGCLGCERYALTRSGGSAKGHAAVFRGANLAASMGWTCWLTPWASAAGRPPDEPYTEPCARERPYGRLLFQSWSLVRIQAADRACLAAGACLGFEARLVEKVARSALDPQRRSGGFHPEEVRAQRAPVTRVVSCSAYWPSDMPAAE